MRIFNLFYSWQSDRPSSLCRQFIAEALRDAAEKIRQSREVIVVIDADTQGVSGTPPISETILRKIDACDAFLADLTLVARTDGGKASPNPNVLIEYGYALKAKGSGHVLLAMNTAFGDPGQLPFDLRHLRHPLQYEAVEGVPDGERRRRRMQLAERLVVALNAVIDQPPAKKKASARSADPYAQAAKRLLAFQAGRASLAEAIYRPRLIIDIAPLAINAERRLDLRAVKAARPWFTPDDGCDAETSTRHGEWLSIDPRFDRRWPGASAYWSTRLVAPGLVERAISFAGEETWMDVELDGWSCDRQIISAVRRSGALLAAIGLGGPALVALTLEEAAGLSLRGPAGQGPKVGDATVSIPPIEVRDLADPQPSELRPLLDELWQACGFEDGSPSIDAAGWVIGPAPPHAPIG